MKEGDNVTAKDKIVATAVRAEKKGEAMLKEIFDKKDSLNHATDITEEKNMPVDKIGRNEKIGERLTNYILKHIGIR